MNLDVHSFRSRWLLATPSLAIALVGAASAQSTGSAPPPPAAAASAPRSAARPAAAASAAEPQRVEITGRANEVEARRQSTAAKIIIGREEIDSFGDSTVGEVLKRLPGVTMQGAPGRGGAIRMRGLGSGYTQILLDGQRVPPGFSIDSLTPEQIERIEILRAPTAETGARAIAGTINIITREGFTKKLNDVRVAVATEAGRAQPNVAWTRNGGEGGYSYNLSMSAFGMNRPSHTEATTTDQTLATGAITRIDRVDADTVERRRGLNVTGRLQWRNEAGEQLMLMPILFYGTGRTERTLKLNTLLADPTRCQPSTDTGSVLDPRPCYDHAGSDGTGHFVLMRMNTQVAHRLGDTRLEWRGGVGMAQSANVNDYNERAANEGLMLTNHETNSWREPSFSLNLKASRLMGEDHSVVGGAEVDASRREEDRVVLQNGVPQLADFGENFKAQSVRLAAYVQDEWKVNEQWSAHAGLRWEGITTQGDALDGGTDRNRSSVWTPLAHAVWRPDPKSKDQVRISLTRSYRAPTLQNLIARPRLATGGRNSETTPDSAGNPNLVPELASGIDIAFERYLPASGLVSVNVFRRNISNLMRTTTTLETVPWDTAPRWVSRPKNVGDAITEGVEMEAKFRLNEVFEGTPAMDVRANLSLFRSRVNGVAGPDNRLDQQPSGTMNLGGDYRLRGGWPLTVGGNFNYTPSYRTQLTDQQAALQGKKRAFDAYALWTLQPGVQLRLSGSNIAPLPYETGRSVQTTSVLETVDTVARSYVNWQLRLELKL